MTRKKALVLSYSPVARDPRVRRQIQWLTFAGFEVEVWGLGAPPGVGEATYNEIAFPPLPTRIFTYLFSSSKRRSDKFVGSQLSTLFSDLADNKKPDLVILNDLDFLGLEELFSFWGSQETKVALDLHEYFFDMGGSKVWRILNDRYYHWLLKNLKSRSLSQIFTVSEEIAKLYETKLSRALVSIENSPDSIRLRQLTGKSSQIEGDRTIHLVHHGLFGRGRGVLRLVRAMRLVDTRFDLNLVLLMSPLSRLVIIGISCLYGVRRRVKIHEPVPFSDLLNKLSSFDVQLIFFHPPHSMSVHYSLPNKFFETLAAGLGIVVGPSPSMSGIVSRYALGSVVESWKTRHLAEAINELSPEAINRAKNNTSRALFEYSDKKIQEKFFRALEIVLS